MRWQQGPDLIDGGTGLDPAFVIIVSGLDAMRGATRAIATHATLEREKVFNFQLRRRVSFGKVHHGRSLLQHLLGGCLDLSRGWNDARVKRCLYSGEANSG